MGSLDEPAVLFALPLPALPEDGRVMPARGCATILTADVWESARFSELKLRGLAVLPDGTIAVFAKDGRTVCACRLGQDELLQLAAALALLAGEMGAPRSGEERLASARVAGSA